MYLRDLKRLIFISLLINTALHKLTAELLCDKRGRGHLLNVLGLLIIDKDGEKTCYSSSSSVVYIW